MAQFRAAGWWTVAVLSFLVAAYASMYLVFGERMFPDGIAESLKARPWGIFPHALFGAIALAAGPLQFHPRIQMRTALHRRLGMAYIAGALLVGTAGVYMGVYAFGGMVSQTGFVLMGLGTVAATAIAYRHIRMGHYRAHREWMMRSFAFIFGAPTQRLWLIALLIASQGDFDLIYPWTAWLAWVPNLIVAEWLVRRSRREPVRFGGRVIESLPAAQPRVAVPAGVGSR